MPTPEAIDLVGRVRARYKAPGNEHELELTEAAEEIDRFGAQRGAEIDDELEPGELRPCPFCGGEAQRGEADDGGSFIECSRCGASTPLHYDRCESLIPNWNNRVKQGAQTGGGDAPRRHLTRDEVRIMDRALLASSTLIHAGELAGGDAGERALLERAREIAAAWCPEAGRETATGVIFFALRSSHREGAEEARQDALRVPFTKALVAEAGTQGYQEGAEAMREAEAQFLYDMLNLRGLDSLAIELRRHMRALPIPGKTDVE